jgi:hypothetical protein
MPDPSQSNVNAPGYHYYTGGTCYPYTIFHEAAGSVFDGWYYTRPLGLLPTPVNANNVALDGVNEETFHANATNNTVHAGGNCCT